MTAAPLRVPRTPPVASPNTFSILPMPGGAWPGNTFSSSYYNGKTYIGYVDVTGGVFVTSFNHTTHAIVTSPVIISGLSEDLHSAPAVLVRQSDHKIVIAVAPHDSAHMYIAVSTNAEDVSSWPAATDIQPILGDSSMTYSNLVQLSGESGKIYLFYRQGAAHATSTLKYSTSTDGGATWSASTSLYTPGVGIGSYWAIDSDSTSRIDFSVSDGDASGGTASTGSLFHFYYSGGGFFKSDGTTISVSQPYAPSNLTKIYDGSNGALRAPYAFVGGTTPTVVFASANVAGWSGNPENYWYATYAGGAWSANDITSTGIIPTSGGLFEGGITLSRSNPNRVFLSKSDGTVSQIYLYVTSNGGTSWTTSQLTTLENQPSWHPISPRNQAVGLEALWSFGPVDASNTFSAQILGYPPNEIS